MKKTLLAILIGLSYLAIVAWRYDTAPKKLGATVSASSLSSMVQVNAIVETVVRTIPCRHVFQNATSGAIVYQEGTKASCDSLAGKNAPQPTMAGYKWVQSEGGVPVISTSTPVLLDNQYYIDTPQSATTTEVIVQKSAGQLPVTEIAQ